MTAIESVPGPAPAVPGKGCGSYCSFHGKPLPAGDVTPPCAGCYSEEIRTAVLHCASCGGEYPVIEGIPRFVPDIYDDYPEFPQRYASSLRKPPLKAAEKFQTLHRATKKSFGFQWLRYRVTDHQENRDHLYDRTGTQPGMLGRKLFFEAGCGMGRYLKVFSDEPGAEVVGLDLSLAVNRAYEENRNNPLIHVIQGNIMNLPLRPGTFDHAYSIGVLHHTPSTYEACRSVARLVKPGGQLSIWVYHVWKHPGISGFAALHASVKGAVTDGLRAVTTRIPHSVLHYLCYLAIPVGWVQLRIMEAPKPVRVLLSPLLLVNVSVHPKPEVRLLDTFDWYSPQYQWKHTVAEVEGWFRELGLERIDSQGFPVSVRGHRPPDPPRA